MLLGCIHIRILYQYTDAVQGCDFYAISRQPKPLMWMQLYKHNNAFALIIAPFGLGTGITYTRISAFCQYNLHLY